MELKEFVKIMNDACDWIHEHPDVDIYSDDVPEHVRLYAEYLKMRKEHDESENKILESMGLYKKPEPVNVSLYSEDDLLNL